MLVISAFGSSLVVSSVGVVGLLHIDISMFGHNNLTSETCFALLVAT